MTDACTTPTCPGDPRYASPGRGHLPECPYPKPYDGPPLSPAAETMPGPYLAIILLFAAAADGANREEKRRLWEARQMLKTRAPLPDIGRAILDSRGPDWRPPDEVVQAIQNLHPKED